MSTAASSTAPTRRAAVRPRTVRDLSRKNTPGLKKAASIPAAVSSGRSSSPAVIDAPAPSPSYHAPTGDETLSASVVDPLAAALAALPSPMPSPKAALQSVTPVSADVPAGRTIGPDVAMTDDPFDIPLHASTSASSASAPQVTAAAAVGPVHTRWTEPVSPAHGSLALEPDSPPDSPVHSWCAVLGAPSFSVPWPDLWQGAVPHTCDPTPRPRTAHSYRPTYRPTDPPRQLATTSPSRLPRRHSRRSSLEPFAVPRPAVPMRATVVWSKIGLTCWCCCGWGLGWTQVKCY